MRHGIRILGSVWLLAISLLGSSTLAQEKLQYSVTVVEVPTKDAMPIVEPWQLLTASKLISQDNNSKASGVISASFTSGVIPASENTTVAHREMRLSEPLSPKQVSALVKLGKSKMAPRTVGLSGGEIQVRFGRDVDCTVSYQPAKDSSGDSTGAMEPVVMSLHEGTTMNVTGTVDEQLENIDLQIGLTELQLERFEEFKMELETGPATVDQPLFDSFSTGCTTKVPVNATIAISIGHLTREKVVQKSVPVIGRLPYVGKLLEYDSKSTESITKIVLVHCQLHTAQAAETTGTSP